MYLDLLRLAIPDKGDLYTGFFFGCMGRFGQCRCTVNFFAVKTRNDVTFLNASLCRRRLVVDIQYLYAFTIFGVLRPDAEFQRIVERHS